MATPGYGKRSAPGQRPRHADDFALLPVRERYVAAFIDRLPTGAAMSVKSLARQLPLYGQQAVGSALTALSVAGHLRRVRCPAGQGDQVRWSFRTFWSRTARDNEWWNTYLAAQSAQGPQELQHPRSSPNGRTPGHPPQPSAPGAAAPPSPWADDDTGMAGAAACGGPAPDTGATDTSIPHLAAPVARMPEAAAVPRRPVTDALAPMPDVLAPVPDILAPMPDILAPVPDARVVVIPEAARSAPASAPAPQAVRSASPEPPGGAPAVPQPQGPAPAPPDAPPRTPQAHAPAPAPAVPPQRTAAPGENASPAVPGETASPAVSGDTASPAYLALARLGRVDHRVALSAAECADLEELAAAWFARGVDGDYLVQALTTGLPAHVGRPQGLVRRRLLDKLPPHLPTTPTPAPPPGATARRVLVECTACGVPGRPEALPDGLCRPCRAVAATGPTPPMPSALPAAPASPAAASDGLDGLLGTRDVHACVAELRDLLRPP
ncbi:MarR family transcriptional regulator [Streptomyces pratensis]|uniref:MarR family transcriptional regulator n=1 Tax=Streptomyces pratensis TaxID=1169025 RepID=UPI00301814D7